MNLALALLVVGGALGKGPTNLGEIVVRPAESPRPVTAFFLSPPGLPQLEARQLPDAAQAPYAQWLAAGNAQADAARRADTAMVEAQRALEVSAAQALEAALGAAEASLGSGGWALWAELRRRSSAAAMDAAMDAYQRCLEERWDCPEPKPDDRRVREALGHVDAREGEALAAWAQLALAMQADLAGEPDAAKAAFAAALALEHAPPAMRRYAALSLGMALAADLDLAALPWLELAAHPGLDPAVEAPANAPAEPTYYAPVAAYTALRLETQVGDAARALRSALAWLAEPGMGAELVAEVQQLGALAAARLGPQAVELARDATPEARAALLLAAARVLIDDGSLRWARATLDGLERLDPQAQPAIAALRDGLPAPSAESARAWAERVVNACRVQALHTSPWQDVDITLRPDPKGGVQSRTGRPLPEGSPLRACLEGPLPPPEAASVGAVRFRLVRRDGPEVPR